MSWSLAQAVNSLGQAWVQAGAPVFGGMIARKDYDALDRLFFRLSGRALAIGSLAAVGAWGVVYLLNVVHHPLAARVLAPLPTGVFLGGMLLTLGSQCISVYLRAHKREPLFALNVVSCVAIGISAWLLGRTYGALGMALGFAAVMGVGVLPWSAWKWFVYRREWHAR
jgi:O-antigen/teichoic acid export membrane protein